MGREGTKYYISLCFVEWGTESVDGLSEEQYGQCDKVGYIYSCIRYLLEASHLVKRALGLKGRNCLIKIKNCLRWLWGIEGSKGSKGSGV